MSTLINYFVEANLSLCFFLMAYVLFLRNETDFRFKRAFMIIALVTSLVVPLFHLGADQEIPSLSMFVPAYWLPEIVVTYDGAASAAQDSANDPWFYAGVIYWSGVALFFLVFAIQLIRLGVIIYGSPKYKLGKFLVIESEERKTTFSFFRYIFLGQSGTLSAHEKQQIIDHESVHAGNYHSADILLINLMIVFFWFNPLLRIYRKIIVQLHEFEADSRAVMGHDVNNYCSLLARVALQAEDFAFANHFTNSLTIKRIDMIRKNKTKISSWKLVGMTAIVTVFFYLITSQDQVIAQVTPVPQGQEHSSNEVFETVDDPAVYYENGMEGLGSFISRNLRYSKDARQKGIEGTVFVSFVVEKNGTMSDVGIEKGVEKSLDDEALRVVKMTKWLPGKQSGKIVRSKMVLPVKYKLN